MGLQVNVETAEGEVGGIIGFVDRGDVVEQFPEIPSCDGLAGGPEFCIGKALLFLSVVFLVEYAHDVVEGTFVIGSVTDGEVEYQPDGRAFVVERNGGVLFASQRAIVP